MVAQQIKNCLEPKHWSWVVRKALYGLDGENPQESPLINELVQLCSRVNSPVASVINFNYDDTFESALRKTNRKFEVVSEAPKSSKDVLQIFHPHGYLPFTGGAESKKVILAESDYQQEYAEPYSWGNLVSTRALTGSTCVFFGLSMTDPNLRRLTRIASASFPVDHYCFLASLGTEDHLAKAEVLFNRDLKTMGINTVRYNSARKHAQLVSLVEALSGSLA